METDEFCDEERVGGGEREEGEEFRNEWSVRNIREGEPGCGSEGGWSGFNRGWVERKERRGFSAVVGEYFE